MVRHIVLWRLKEKAHGNDKATNAQLVKEKLEALNGNIEGLIHLEVGIGFDKTEDNSDIVLVSEFVSREHLAAYQVHPAHRAVMPFVAEARNERRVVDYDMPDK